MTKDWLSRQVTVHLARIVSWMNRQDYRLTESQHRLLMEIVSIDKSREETRDEQGRVQDQARQTSRSVGAAQEGQ